jgi:SAM-dependent methyltransferase
MRTAATTEQFFEEKYRRNPDPWNFSASDYERQRYSTIMRALAGRRYARALEPGCSIGVLTERLANLCDRVEALDISATAVKIARARCRGLKNVTFMRASIAHIVPPGEFDLIVFSEIGYYFDEYQLAAVAQGLVGHLINGGIFLAVHWLGVSGDHLLSGRRVHEILGRTEGLVHLHAENHHKFLLDRWEHR